MKTKTYILDTNVLLSDPMAFFCFGKEDIILPLTVLEELDRNKSRLDETSRNAREVVRKLAKLTKNITDFKQGIPLGEGLGNLYIYSIMDFPIEYRENIPKEGELTTLSGDNQILNIALALHNNALEPYEFVLVTKDVLLRLKAQALGMPCEDYTKEYNKNASGSSNLYTGILETSEPVDLLNFYKNGKVDLPENLTSELYPNQFIVVNNEAIKGGSALMRYNSSTKEAKKIIEYSPCKIEPRSKEQRFAIDLLMDPNIHLVTLAGKAGGGKTLISLSCGLHQVMDLKRYKTLIVAKPTVPMGRDIGFLPGELKEKISPWMEPIRDNLRQIIFPDGRRTKQTEDSLEFLFDNGTIQMEALTFLRGRSISNAFILIDEAQNLSLHELKTILTRAAEGTKIVLTGDFSQIDDPKLDSINNGLTIAIEKFKDQQIAGHVTLQKGERSALATISAEIVF